MRKAAMIGAVVEQLAWEVYRSRLLSDEDRQIFQDQLNACLLALDIPEENC